MAHSAHGRSRQATQRGVDRMSQSAPVQRQWQERTAVQRMPVWMVRLCRMGVPMLAHLMRPSAMQPRPTVHSAHDYRLPWALVLQQHPQLATPQRTHLQVQGPTAQRSLASPTPHLA